MRSRGTLHYLLIAGEIDAAMREDWTLSQREIGRRIGRSQAWVSNLMKWYRSLPGCQDPDRLCGDSTSEGCSR